MRTMIHRTTARIQDRSQQFQRDEEGAGVLEYSLVAAVVSVALVAASLTFGQSAVNSATAEIAAILP